MATTEQNQAGGIPRALPADRLKGEFKNLLGAVRDRALAALKGTVGQAAGRLADYADQGGGPGFMAAVTGARRLSEGKSPARALLAWAWPAPRASSRRAGPGQERPQPRRLSSALARRARAPTRARPAGAV